MRSAGNSITNWLTSTTAGQTIIFLAGTALLFALSPLLFGSATVLLKGVIGVAVPTAIMSIAALITNLAYSKLILPLLSNILGKTIWGIGTKGMACCGLGRYGLNAQTLTNSKPVVSVCASSIHYLLLCGTLAIYSFHAYSQMLHPNLYDLLLCGAVGAWIGASLMFTEALKNETGHYNTGIFKILAIGAANGIILSGTQLVIGHFFCTVTLEMGYMGAIVGCASNLVIAPYLAKTLLQLLSDTQGVGHEQGAGL